MNQSESQDVERPSRKILLVWKLSNAITFGIAFAIALVVTLGFLLFSRTFPWFGVVAILAILGLWLLSILISERQWEHWYFKITPDALEMGHGWIWRSRRVVARDRIQHVDINSGPFDRKFGLVQVVVYTAGTTVGMIPGLDPDRAQRLREQLLAGRPVE